MAATDPDVPRTVLRGRGRTDQEVAGLIESVERHVDGYFRAHVNIDGKRFYLTSRYGSWLVPEQSGEHRVLREPEGVFGPILGRELKFALQDRARRAAR